MTRTPTTARRFDVIHLTDPRFTGGTTSAVVTQAIAEAEAGLSVAVLPVASGLFGSGRAWNPKFITLIERPDVHRLGPGESTSARLVLCHHPGVFLNTPSRPVAIAADHVLLVVHEPPAHRGGPALYRPREILDRLSRLFVRPALLAPVGPAARDALVSAGASAADMLPFDLHNLIDLNAWPSVSRGSGTERLTIGRHARSDASKWPEKASTVLAAYPNRAWLDVHVLGGPPPEDVMPAVPANWHVLPQDGMDVAAFLARLDVYVWFASSRRIEAFGLALAEAMASGLPVITSRDFEPLFGEGPIYCQPDNVESQLERLRADPERRLMLGAACRRAIRDRFDARLAGRRHERVLSALETAVPPPTPAPRPALRRPRGGVLFVTSNGVGLGHVSRLLAIARKLDPGTPAAFFTLSGAAGVIAEAGFPLDYMPSHLALKLRSTPWNDSLARRWARRWNSSNRTWSCSTEACPTRA